MPALRNESLIYWGLWDVAFRRLAATRAEPSKGSEALETRRWVCRPRM